MKESLRLTIFFLLQAMRFFFFPLFSFRIFSCLVLNCVNLWPGLAVSDTSIGQVFWVFFFYSSMSLSMLVSAQMRKKNCLTTAGSSLVVL